MGFSGGGTHLELVFDMRHIFVELLSHSDVQRRIGCANHMLTSVSQPDLKGRI